MPDLDNIPVWVAIVAVCEYTFADNSLLLNALQVTSVSVCNLGLRKLSCLDHLPNLRWLSLAGNALSNIEVGHSPPTFHPYTQDRRTIDSLDLTPHVCSCVWE